MYIKGYSQRQLAEKVGVSAINVWGWCNGKYLPRAGVLDKLCKVLNVTEAGLMTDKNRNVQAPEEEVIASAITARTDLMSLFRLATIASEEDIQLCIDILTRVKK